MDPCAASSARTLFNNQELIRALTLISHCALNSSVARHSRASNTRWCVCEVKGESLELVRNFAARESVRVSLALKFADVAQSAERESSKLDGLGSIPIVRPGFRCTLRFSCESSERAS